MSSDSGPDPDALPPALRESIQSLGGALGDIAELDREQLHELSSLLRAMGEDAAADLMASRRDVLKMGGSAAVAALTTSAGLSAFSEEAKGQTGNGTIGDGNEDWDINKLTAKQLANNPPADELTRGRPTYHDDGNITVGINEISETRTVAGNSYEVLLLPYYIDGQIEIDANGDVSGNNYLVPPYTSHRYSTSEGSVSALFIRGGASSLVGSLAFVHTNDTQSKVKDVEFAGEDPGSDENVAVASYGSHVSIDGCTFDSTDHQNGVLTYGTNSHVDIEGSTDMGGVGQMITQKHGGTYGVLNGGVTGSAGYLVANGRGPVCAVSDISGGTFSNGIHRRDGVRGPTVNADNHHIIQGYGAEGARVYLGTDFTSLPGDGSLTKVPIDTVAYDDRSEFASSNNRIATTDAGRYQIEAKAAIDGATDGDVVSIVISANGFHRQQFPVGATGYLRLGTSTTLDLPAGEGVELFVTQNSGSSATVASGATETSLAVNRIG